MKAFPSPYVIDEHGGMDLRDYFAAQAMQAMLKNNPALCQTLTFEEDEEIYGLDAGCLAEGAYNMADAMIEARTLASRGD